MTPIVIQYIGISKDVPIEIIKRFKSAGIHLISSFYDEPFIDSDGVLVDLGPSLEGFKTIKHLKNSVSFPVFGWAYQNQIMVCSELNLDGLLLHTDELPSVEYITKEIKSHYQEVG